MWGKCPPTYYLRIPMNRCTRCTSSICPFLPFLLMAGILHDIRPHQTCTSTGMCQEREEEWGRFRLQVSTELSADSALVVDLGPEPFTSGPISSSVRACLFVGLSRPPLSFICRDFSNCMLILWSLE